MQTVRGAFWAGVRALMPIVMGVVPVALITGVVMVSNGLSFGQAAWMSVWVYAGSAQLVALQMFGSHAPTALVILTGLVVNLRFLVYSASMIPYLQARTWLQKVSVAYVMTDQSYAVSMSRFQLEPHLPNKRWFYLGTGVAMWCTWQFGTLLGMLVGTQIPSAWQLDFTIPLAFIALLVPQLRSQKILIVAAVAGLAAVLTASLPFKLGLVVSVLAGIGTGVALEERER